MLTADEPPWRFVTFDLTGSTRVSNLGFTTFDESQRLFFHSVMNAKTAAPRVVWTRGTAGNDCELVDNTQIVQAPDNQEVDALQTADYVLSPGSGSQWRYLNNGVLFDFTQSFLAGVTGATDGPAIALGALSATQTLQVYYASLHDPAFTATSADALLENADDSGFTTGVQTEHTFAQLTASGYETVKITGAETQTFYRLRVTAVVGGAYFPVCLAFIYETP